ncbi:helix-turn-helix domain-containing protein [Streptomyces sp. KLOTTS4A1]|uniref:helix-turn-helix domain-containing protein n=1 Tax=Streptomyces sp. KLOTTS4A1 TaxID=3390996 RepID=UPI0039F4ADE8
MSTETNLAWRYCGNQIKLWREQAGLTREALVKETGYSLDYVKSMENGRRKPTTRLLRVADQLCEAGGKIVAAQGFLKPEAHPERAQEYMALQRDAISVSQFHPLLVPGLLQTERYAHALISASYPPLDDEMVESRVAGRIRRQQSMVERKTALFSFVLYEAALRTPVGGSEVMGEQLRQLLELGKLRQVVIQVLPYGQAYGVALNGPIVLLETPDNERYAYVEGPQTSALYAEGEKASKLARAHDMIRVHALSPEGSVEFIRKVAAEL